MPLSSCSVVSSASLFQTSRVNLRKPDSSVFLHWMSAAGCHIAQQKSPSEAFAVIGNSGTARTRFQSNSMGTGVHQSVCGSSPSFLELRLTARLEVATHIFSLMRFSWKGRPRRPRRPTELTSLGSKSTCRVSHASKPPWYCT